MRITSEDVKEYLGGVVFVVLVGILLWLYLEATPDQYSAECEALRAEMQEEGLID